MTPQEKAKELVDNFTFIDNGEKLQLVTTKDKIKAKQCALICVDEILEELDAECWGLEMDRAFERQRFWLNIKQEIEKL